MMNAPSRRRMYQDGQSLIEMITVVAIFLIAMAIITSAFLMTQKTSDVVDNRFENQGEAQKLIAALSRDVRSATKLAPTVAEPDPSPFLCARRDRIAFYANLSFVSPPTAVSNADRGWPDIVDLLVDPADPKAPILREYTWVATNTGNASATAPVYASTPACNSSLPTGFTALRLVGQYVANTPSQPLFTYYDGAGNVLTPPVNGSLSAADQRAVRSIKISLEVRKSTGRSVKPSHVETTVILTNLA